VDYSINDVCGVIDRQRGIVVERVHPGTGIPSKPAQSRRKLRGGRRQSNHLESFGASANHQVVCAKRSGFVILQSSSKEELLKASGGAIKYISSKIILS